MTHASAYRASITIIFCVFTTCTLSFAAELKQATIDAFEGYVAATESRFTNQLRPNGSFLFVDGLPLKASTHSHQRLQHGEILIEKVETRAGGQELKVPDGIVHHWVGVIFIPGTTLAKTLPIVQDYARREQIFKPDVTASRVLWHHGSDYKIFLRLHQKRFTTAVFNTEYEIHWGHVDAKRMYSNSYATRIAEVRDPNHPDYGELPIGKDHGYLWRLNTYWRFAEKDGGVYMQCEAVSLTRDIPAGIGWLLRPLVTAIPKQSLTRVLSQTRNTVVAEAKLVN